MMCEYALSFFRSASHGCCPTVTQIGACFSLTGRWGKRRWETRAVSLVYRAWGCTFAFPHAKPLGRTYSRDLPRATLYPRSQQRRKKPVL